MRLKLTLLFCNPLLLLKTLLLTIGIRLGLWVYPYQTMQRLAVKLGRLSIFGIPKQPEAYLTNVRWIVPSVGHRIPRATCLTQALVAKVLLDQAHIPNELQAGFKRNNQGKLEGHAWLISDGEVVVGGDITAFIPMTIFDRTSLK